MRPARIIVLLIAVVAGGLAALLASRSNNPSAPAPAPVAKIDTVEVLVAAKDISLGQVVGPQDVKWQEWPKSAASAVFVRRDAKANAIQDLAGAIARTPFVAGEPIREAKLIKANGSGFMAAILPPGMRAISTEISPETGAGGFILPNDHVDVILTRRPTDTARTGRGNLATSETILTNVRVLAIDQTVEEKDGQRVVVGKTATLELSPRQAETLALARQLGTLSLALRSIADIEGAAAQANDLGPEAPDREINMVRFGVTTTTLQK
ncbi:MAG TPA: Flp pilus assembly protein CpaB [Xanthobacteraceae bacterium]|nr:Flp pilus assembly protein CpaB [Xanthobacteraceae bacterium]